MALLSTPKKGRGGRAALKSFGNHPVTGDDIQLFNGPYGLYVKAGKTNASLPEGETAESFTLEKALEVLNAKMGPLLKKAAKKAKGGASKVAKAATKVVKAAAKTASAGSNVDKPQAKSAAPTTKLRKK